jgi:enoyl-CoA hydratase/carnithine racemase
MSNEKADPILVAATVHAEAVSETDATRTRFKAAQAHANGLRDKFAKAERLEAAALQAYMRAVGRGETSNAPTPKE